MSDAENSPSMGPTEELSFESALARIEEIVRRLEEGGLPLEESLRQYEVGVVLLRRCYGQLREAEQKVLALAGEDDEGRPILEPFERLNVTEVDPPQARRRPRRQDGAGDL